jgi:CubicO group peptidase (beta-lactamase class C family)
VIEHVTGRPLSAVLRDGVLNIDGMERLVYQPDEVPTEPMAMPFGGTTAALENGGGFLPSLAHASGGGGAWGIASDSPSLARWWRALCSGEIVSQDSLTQMTPKQDDYGLGIFSFPNVSAYALGHPGVEVGYVSWSACLPEDGTVIVVLANGEVDDLFGLARPLIVAGE